MGESADRFSVEFNVYYGDLRLHMKPCPQALSERLVQVVPTERQLMMDHTRRFSLPRIETATLHLPTPFEPGIEGVQALADISRAALCCCRSNETRSPIANPPNSAQLEDTPTIPPTYIRVRAVVWECGEGQTDR